MAVLEVCRFNDWLIRMLRDYGCHKVILIQPDERKRRKTDRRDVAALSELLWANRVGRVERFPRAHSLANYWGLTPGCRNSGESDQRLGRITKAGSATARWLLAQLVHKVLRRRQFPRPLERSPWFWLGLKKRRSAAGGDLDRQLRFRLEQTII